MNPLFLLLGIASIVLGILSFFPKTAGIVMMTSRQQDRQRNVQSRNFRLATGITLIIIGLAFIALELSAA